MPRRAWIRHPVLAVVIVAAAVRLWSLELLPLIITNDGVGYLGWAQDIYHGKAWTIPPVRTPGYPLLLAGIFEIFGVGPFGVLVVQHILGIALAAIITRVIELRHGRRWAIGIGLIVALSPSIMVWEFYALTEIIAGLAVVSVFAFALCAKPGAKWGLVLGALLGAMCLVRPNLQLLVPFVALGWMLRADPARRTRALSIGAVLVGLGITIAPWLVHNAHRGIYGLARGGQSTVWWGMARYEILDESYPLPPSIKEEYDRLRAGAVTDERLGQFLGRLDAQGNPNIESTLSAWTRKSLLDNPGKYGAAVWNCITAQLELRPAISTDTGWCVWRLAKQEKKGPGNFTESDYTRSQKIEQFAMSSGQGSAARSSLWLVRHKVRGMPQLPLLLCALVVGASLLIRRQWAEAIFLLGTCGLFFAHPVMLQPYSRYGFPVWVCWFLFVPDAFKVIKDRWTRIFWKRREAAP